MFACYHNTTRLRHLDREIQVLSAPLPDTQICWTIGLVYCGHPAAGVIPQLGWSSGTAFLTDDLTRQAMPSSEILTKKQNDSLA
jgi:hypothetical protein